LEHTYNTEAYFGGMLTRAYGEGPDDDTRIIVHVQIEDALVVGDALQCTALEPLCVLMRRSDG